MEIDCLGDYLNFDDLEENDEIQYRLKVAFPILGWAM